MCLRENRLTTQINVGEVKKNGRETVRAVSRRVPVPVRLGGDREIIRVLNVSLACLVPQDLRENVPFLSFPYVRPEPVLVK